MIVLPGLTTTDRTAVGPFLRALTRGRVRAIALYPTTLDPAERRALYRDLEAIPGLALPHVHLRTDCDAAEMDYLVTRFGAECFNIHPGRSKHPFGPAPPEHVRRIFIENVEVPPQEDELEDTGGICPDYSHLESARHRGDQDYVATTESAMTRFAIGCCHVSAIRVGHPNGWNGGWDHHRFAELSDLDYMRRYRDRLPPRWVSLELENGLDEQMEAAAYVEELLGL